MPSTPPKPWQRAVKRGERGERLVYIPRGNSKPRFTVPDGCAKKHRDSDEVTARARAASRLAEPECNVDKLWPYPCKHCHGWHLTSRKQPKTAAVTRDSTYVKE